MIYYDIFSFFILQLLYIFIKKIIISLFGFQVAMRMEIYKRRNCTFSCRTSVVIPPTL